MSGELRLKELPDRYLLTRIHCIILKRLTGFPTMHVIGPCVPNGLVFTQVVHTVRLLVHVGLTLRVGVLGEVSAMLLIIKFIIL